MIINHVLPEITPTMGKSGRMAVRENGLERSNAELDVNASPSAHMRSNAELDINVFRSAHSWLREQPDVYRSNQGAGI